MQFSLLLCSLSSLPIILGAYVKPGSVESGGSRLRCGVVAIDNGEIWMVKSKQEGYILPKGGYDSNVDRSYEDCVMREAREEAGVELDRSTIQRLGSDDPSIHWYMAEVNCGGARTDAALSDRGAPSAFSVSQARSNLQQGSKTKKKGMQGALEEAVRKAGLR